MVTSSWQRSNDPDNFDIPEAVRLAIALDLTMTAEPASALVSFCVFYAADGVRLVEFSGSRQRTLSSGARDKRCTP